jgi:hypothetical protein
MYKKKQELTTSIKKGVTKNPVWHSETVSLRATSAIYQIHSTLNRGRVIIIMYLISFINSALVVESTLRPL